MNSDDGNTRDKTEFIYFLNEGYSRDVQLLASCEAACNSVRRLSDIQDRPYIRDKPNPAFGDD